MLALALGLEQPLAEELVEQALREPAGLDVLPVQEEAAGLEQVERLLVERALALVRQVVDREARDDRVEALAGRQAVAPAGVDEIRRARSPSGPPCGARRCSAAASIGSEKSTSTPRRVRDRASSTSSAKPPSPAPEVAEAADLRGRRA